MSATQPEPVASAIAYRRVSTEDQARPERSSLGDQRAAILALAARLGASVATWFDDPGASGAGAETRPGFMRMIEHCRSHPRSRRSPGLVLVLNDSRWGRFTDLEESTYWRVHLRKLGWDVRFAEGGEVEDRFANAMLRTVHSAQSTAYREAIRANATRGARACAAKGQWLNEAPFGYRRRATSPGREPVVLEPGQRKASDQQVRLTPGPEVEQRAVRWLFATYAAGAHGIHALAAQLADQFPDRRWSGQAVGRMLRSRTYLGDVIWCRRPHDHAERQEIRVRPETEWVIAEGAHPALITPDVFDAVQTRLQINRKATRAVAGGYPLSGLIHCAQCGMPYTGGGGPHGPKSDPDRYRFYRDSGSNGVRPCCTGFTGTLQRRWVEPLVIEEIARVADNAQVRAAIAAAFDRLADRVPVDQDTERAELEVTRERTEAATRRLVRAVANGTLTERDAAGELACLRAEERRVRTALEQLRFADRRVNQLATERDRLVQLATDFRGLAQRLAGAELRELIRPWLQAAVVDKAKRVLVLTIRRLPTAGAILELATQPGPG